MGETIDFGGAGFDRLLSDTQRALNESGESGDASASMPELRAEGEAADGRIKATVVTGGRLESVRLDPRALRMGSEDLGREIVTAVNAALDDLQRQTEEQAAELGMPDREALTDQLNDLQNHAAQRLNTFSQTLDDVMRRLDRMD